MHKTFDIISKFKFAVIIPIVVFIVGIIFCFTTGPDLSIDFKGGTSVTYSYTNEIDYEKVKTEAENALKNVSKETILKYSYEGELDSDAVATALNEEEFEGFKFSSETADSVLTVSAVSSKFLQKNQIDEITAILNSRYADNKINYKSNEQNSFDNVKLEVRSSADLSSGAETIRLNAIGNTALTSVQLDRIENTLVEKFPDNNINEVQSNAVSESFGSSFFAKSIFAVILASILVIIYVGYRFRKVGGLKAGITALAALVHDVLFVFFINVIFGITIDINFIAVFLTILGYSLNDTIVIYDRIRENAGIYGNKKSIRELTNISIAQSMKRTCVTSLTTFSAIMSVTIVAAINGLDSILTFSIPMSVGTIVGTFSSLFVAGPLYVFWCEHSEKKTNKKIEDKNTGKKIPDYTNRINPKHKRKKSY